MIVKLESKISMSSHVYTGSSSMESRLHIAMLDCKYTAGTTSLNAAVKKSVFSVQLPVTFSVLSA
jgi:hypothetical protein